MTRIVEDRLGVKVSTAAVEVSAGAADAGRIPQLDPDGLLDSSMIPVTALDPTLDALALLDGAAGLIEQTGPDAFAKRAMGVGTAGSVLTRADGDGRYALAAHTHAMSDVTGLVAALAAKYDASNPSGYISSITSGMVTTALGYTPTSVTGLTGVQSVAAFKTGLSLVKGDVGLGSVDNTADTAKPVSTAQQTAIDLAMRQASRGGVLRNGLFGEWPSATAVPTGWTDNGSATTPTRATGEAGPYAMTHIGNAAGAASIYQDFGSTTVQKIYTNQKWRLTAEVKLESGALTGSGLTFSIRSSAGAIVETIELELAVDNDTTGSAPGAGTAGNFYRFVKDVTVTHASAFWARFFVSSHNSGHGSIAGANSITWFSVTLEPRI